MTWPLRASPVGACREQSAGRGQRALNSGTSHTSAGLLQAQGTSSPGLRQTRPANRRSLRSALEVRGHICASSTEAAALAFRGAGGLRDLCTAPLLRPHTFWRLGMIDGVLDIRGALSHIGSREHAWLAELGVHRVLGWPADLQLYSTCAQLSKGCRFEALKPPWCSAKRHHACHALNSSARAALLRRCTSVGDSGTQHRTTARKRGTRHYVTYCLLRWTAVESRARATTARSALTRSYSLSLGRWGRSCRRCCQRYGAARPVVS